MYNARLSARILEEATLGARPQGDYYHYEEYKKRFKLLCEFYQLEELLKQFQCISILCFDTVPPDAIAPAVSISASTERGNGL